MGLEVTARNLKGVTIKDACDAIYKQYRKKARSSPIPFSFLLALHTQKLNRPGRRRAGQPRARRLRMEQKGVVDAPRCALQEDGLAAFAQEVKEEG